MLQPIEIKELGDIDLIPQAIIKKPISYFDGLFGIQLTEDHDDQDMYRGVALSMDGELRFALKHYAGYPADTTTIYLSREFRNVQQITEIVAKIMRELGLPSPSLFWQRGDDPDL